VAVGGGRLAALAQRAGAIVSRDELYEKVWGGKLRPGDRSVDVYVSKLRGKLEAAMPDRRFIHTHPGFGYRFQPQGARKIAGGAAQGADPRAGGAATSGGVRLNRGAGSPRRRQRWEGKPICRTSNCYFQKCYICLLFRISCNEAGTKCSARRADRKRRLSN